MTFVSSELSANAQKTIGEGSALQLLRLIRERKKLAAGNEPHARCSKVKIALLSAYTVHPLVDFLEQELFALGHCAEFFLGEYDSYMGLLLDPESEAHRAKPDFVLVIPSDKRCRYVGSLLDPAEQQRAQAVDVAKELLDACAAFYATTPAEIVLANFPLPGDFALGNARSRYAGSDWTFTKLVNLELGLTAASYVHICDLEFLAHRVGHLRVTDPHGWFESKQIASAEFQILIAAECARLVHQARRPAKKVLALDLDNTLWGGVLAEVGENGIDLGDTSPVGEAYKAFQRYVLGLSERGVVLAVVSKNDERIARQPFLSHPEMVLREQHIAAWRANWESKADNLKQISEELNLGLDSFVFVDDNPAEIAIVNQYAPEVTTVQLTDDPAQSVRLLDERRLFEVAKVTREDTLRTAQYRAESTRRASFARITNMDEYLGSLEMTMAIRAVCREDVPRITQLINKSNQFNLTTRRRTEAEVEALIEARDMRCFSCRLTDRFGDHGLISVVVLDFCSAEAAIDTWLMSCRVLKRQVEDEVLNQIVHLTRQAERSTIVGRYIPTAKNALVNDLLPSLGFKHCKTQGDAVLYQLDVASYTARPSKIAKTA